MLDRSYFDVDENLKENEEKTVNNENLMKSLVDIWITYRKADKDCKDRLGPARLQQRYLEIYRKSSYFF